ncbi:MAG: YfhO family protein, partial [Clostridia bacterium]|nr:YfhO family protein [Clostridia bacterium]
ATSWFVNDGAAYGFNGVRQTSSMTAADTFTFFKQMGLDSNRSNFADYHMQTPVFNSIFGKKYLLEKKGYADYIGFSYLSCAGESYRIADTLKDYSVYRFGNALPLMYTPCRSVLEWEGDGETPFDNQNKFYAAASGLPGNALIPCDENIVLRESREGERVTLLGDHRYQIERVEGVETTADPAAVFSVKARKSGMVYVYAENVKSEDTSVRITVNGRSFFYSKSTSFCGAVYLAEKDEEIEFEVGMGTGADAVILFRVFQLDEKTFSMQYEAITAGKNADLTTFSDVSFSGEIEIAEDNRCICVTVPYDPGWHVRLDGRELSRNEYFLIGGVLYGISAEKGTHTLQFDYRLPGLGLGAALSCLGLLLSLFTAVGLRKKWFFLRRREKQRGNPQ